MLFRSAVITHSGALIGSFGAAGHIRRVGFSRLISTGNEASLDMSDALDFLVEDPDTRVICLAVESVRRPQAFLEAVNRAIAAGKPVIALKLGRSRQGRAIAQSHTGAISGDAWAFEAICRQHGVEIAHDLTELIDRAICFEQLPAAKWSPLEGLAIVTASGGGAGMASDFCEDMDIGLPALDCIAGQVSEVVPGVQVVNPLDMTGVHPESYPVVQKIIETTGQPVQLLLGRADMLGRLRPELFANDSVGVITVKDILKELEKQIGRAHV